MPMWFEDFASVSPEAVTTSPARTVTEADVVAFAAWSGDFNPVHTDAVAAAEGPFGERVAHGLLGLSFCLGLMSRTGEIEGSALALLGVDRWTFRAPIRFGDTVHVRATVIDTRLRTNGASGVVRREFRLVNQDDVVTQEGELRFLIRVRPRT
ncbi:MaoC family dehydratase N-terminal domain-containing protein [Pseudonocardia sp. C8]|uniref:MaoC/PaaZ C-terminal domain-containing protein n=1 Tax=Pseudonocardia sp. C8 TaxID=2762759 RepID=UPI0016428CC2|nr:MaoC/PaaZ C-terminal domain-containing protein [Pseudonocardia sp. C8]MBC3191738.1 MaoC family dehydratase N-terminal domain-containing protein [Pseudonocardia sp. C8]